MRAEGATGVGIFTRRDRFRRARHDQLTALMAALGAKIENPIGTFDDVEMVFDDQDGMAAPHQPLQAIQQPLDIGEVQAGRGFVKNVKVMMTTTHFAQLGGESSLRLPAGKDGGGMALVPGNRGPACAILPACGRSRVGRQRSQLTLRWTS